MVYKWFRRDQSVWDPDLVEEIDERGFHACWEILNASGGCKMQKNGSSNGDVISEVSAYIARGTEAELSAEVTKKAKCHILDTLAAIVSGSQLKAGQLAMKKRSPSRSLKCSHFRDPCRFCKRDDGPC
jgi:hypothetical protein